jgi:hypothetical protein
MVHTMVTALNLELSERGEGELASGQHGILKFNMKFLKLKMIKKYLKKYFKKLKINSKNSKINFKIEEIKYSKIKKSEKVNNVSSQLTAFAFFSQSNLLLIIENI